MKDLLTKIKNSLHSKHEMSQHNLNPHKHWTILLRLFFIVVLFLLLFSFYLLYEIKTDQGARTSDTTKQEPSLLREDLLKNVTQSFDTKAKLEGDLKVNPPIYKDPSL